MGNGKKQRNVKSPIPRGFLFWLLLFFLVISLFRSFVSLPFISTHHADYSNFIEDADRGKVEKVTMKDNEMAWETYDGRRYATQRPSGLDLEDTLQKKNIRVEELPPAESSWWRPLFWYLGPVI